jgi:hypothetical protein
MNKLMNVYMDYNLINVIDKNEFEGNNKMKKLKINGNEIDVKKNKKFKIVK